MVSALHATVGTNITFLFMLRVLKRTVTFHHIENYISLPPNTYQLTKIMTNGYLGNKRSVKIIIPLVIGRSL